MQCDAWQPVGIGLCTDKPYRTQRQPRLERIITFALARSLKDYLLSLNTCHDTAITAKRQFTS